MESSLPLGKLPPELLARLLAKAPISDPRVMLGPGIGMDCAVIDLGHQVLVFKSDPITFASDDIGWYAVQVNANDVATTGATPRWMLATLLLPENQTTPGLVEQIFDQVVRAATDLGISLVGGHTEITYGLNRPILVGTLIGEVQREQLVMPTAARPGDCLLLTKGVPIEGTALLAREFPDRLRPALREDEIKEAANYLYQPGISVVRDARIATQAGQVTAMHDPTEGGLASALWELAEASGRCLWFEPDTVPVPPLARKICAIFGLNPLATIASGALLMTAASTDAPAIIAALQTDGIACTQIGLVKEGPMGVWIPQPGQQVPLPRPQRDDIARVYENQ
jgi:hydrogenase maturation factor